MLTSGAELANSSGKIIALAGIILCPFEINRLLPPRPRREEVDESGRTADALEFSKKDGLTGAGILSTALSLPERICEQALGEMAQACGQTCDSAEEAWMLASASAFNLLDSSWLGF
jgi:hypothetical protein